MIDTSMRLPEELMQEFTAAGVYLDPEDARDRCHEESDRFVAFLEDQGIEAQVVSGFRYTWMYGIGTSHPRRVVQDGHAAVRVGDLVYDWTNRQFDPECEVPTITPYDEWRQDWER